LETRELKSMATATKHNKRVDTRKRISKKTPHLGEIVLSEFVADAMRYDLSNAQSWILDLEAGRVHERDRGSRTMAVLRVLRTLEVLLLNALVDAAGQEGT
jgi:hypothetical protein